MRSPFEGRLVRLRAREPEDVPLLHRWFNDPEVTEFLALRYPLSTQPGLDFFVRLSPPAYSHAGFAVETLADGRLIGGVDLLQTSPENRSARLRIAIGDKTRWGGGYGTDAMRVVCRFGFEMMNLHRIELEVYTPNERAIRVYQKLGFVQECRLRDGFFKHGRFYDVLVMSLLENELREESPDDPKSL